MTYWDAIVQVLSNAIMPAPVTTVLFVLTTATFAWGFVHFECIVDLLWFLLPIALLVLLASLMVYINGNAIGPWSWTPGSAY